jgi:WD40 repeat protein
MIGHGSYGEVWLARNVMGTYRAVKVVRRSTFDDDRPYKREFDGIRKFEPISRSHESQVQILHIGRNDQKGYFYCVMDLADDASVQDKAMADKGIQAAQHSGSPLLQDPNAYVPRTLQHEIQTHGRAPFDQCLRISLALAGALKHLHGNDLVHRDIKPSNIVFVNGIPKLGDIGMVTDSDATMSLGGGSLGFVPPEGPGRTTGDIYSLGKVIYEMCTGQDRMEFPALPENFGDWLDRERVNELLAVSLKACDPDPANRYASAEALLADLVMLQAGKSVRRLRWLERVWRWALWGMAAAVALAVLGWFGASLRVWQQAGRRETLAREAQALRFGERQAGWSSNALYLLKQAGRLGPDSGLRDQAAASLEGLDARLTRQLNTSATALAFDAQGRQVLMDGGEGGHAKLWDLATERVTALQTTNSGPVWFAQDGSPRQFCSDEHGGFWLLNPQNGERLREFSHPPDSEQDAVAVQALTVSADGSLCGAAMVGTNLHRGQLAVWETATGNRLVLLPERCTALAFSPDNLFLATGDSEGRVCVRALPDLREVAVFEQDRAEIHCLAFQRDLSQPNERAGECPWLVAAGDAGGTVCIYQVAGRNVQSICRGSEYDVYALAFSPDGMTLASSGRARVKFWDVRTGRSLLALPGFDFGVALVFSQDGSKLAAGTVSAFGPAVVGVIELQSDQGVRALRGFSSQAGLKMEFSHDGRQLAALSHNWEVGIWNLASNRFERLFTAPKGLVADNAALAFSPDDTQLAFATLKDACLWDIKTGRLLRSWHLPEGLVQQLRFDSAGRLLHFQWESPWNPRARVCRVRDLFSASPEKPLSEFPEFRGQVFDAFFSRSGNLLAVVGKDKNGTNIVRVFDPIKGSEICRLPDTGNSGDDWLVTDPQTTRIGYSRPRSGETFFFDLPGGKPWRRLPLPVVHALAPSGRWLAAETSTGLGVTVFEGDNPERHLVLGWDNRASWPHFSPDGKLLAWGTADGTVLVCDLDETTQRLNRLGLGWR